MLEKTLTIPGKDGNGEEAIRQGEEVIEMYLEAWQAEDELIPEPSTLQIA